MAAFVSAEHGGTTKNADPCAQEMLVVGNCRAAFVKWTYNAQTGKCVQLIWGGCQANTINMFDTEDDCASKCINSQVIN